MTREPAVANQFYDGDPVRLKRDLENLTQTNIKAKPALAVVAPHAGYIYSGGVAGAAYARVDVPETVIISGPNHTGLGSPAAVMDKGSWRMPLGSVPVARDLASRMLERSSHLEADETAHLHEHSLEVQVPFLQFRQPNLSIVPLCLGHLPLDICLDIGSAIAQAVRLYEKPVLLVASTDMTHYESQQRANAKDSLAIDQVLAIDPAGLYHTVRDNAISMCGIVPTVVSLQAALVLGATKAELVRYATSGDVTGDYVQVVGYASFIIS